MEASSGWRRVRASPTPVAVVINKIDTFGLEQRIGEPAVQARLCASPTPTDPAAIRNRVVRDQLMRWGLSDFVHQFRDPVSPRPLLRLHLSGPHAGRGGGAPRRARRSGAIPVDSGDLRLDVQGGTAEAVGMSRREGRPRSWRPPHASPKRRQRTQSVQPVQPAPAAARIPR